MSKATQKQRKVRFLLATLFVIAVLATTLFSVFASGESGETQGWNFNNQAKYATTPIYMEKHIGEVPGTYEAYVNMTEKGTSPIISNFVKTNRGCVKFGVNSNGYPELRLQNFVYVTETAKYYTLKTHVIFDVDDACILNKGWTHIAVTYEAGVEGAGTFTLYVNGTQVQTKKIEVDKPDQVEIIKGSATFNGQYPDIDIETLQSDFRELSFGAEGSTSKGSYFRGSINSAALYSGILTAEEIAAAYQNAVSNSKSYTPDESVMAYYDYDMAGNNGTDFIKDQSGNGHDFVVSFYERENDPEDYAYSFAFVGDTQFTVKFEALDPTKNYASSIYDWLVQNKESKKIKYVLGLGDITESHTTPELWPGEWELAVDLHEKLEAADMPYAIVEGNHDGYRNDPGTINQYFGDNEFFTNTITGYYREGQIDTYYVNFEVGLHKYMILALEHCADDDVLAWANEVVAANPDRRVIVITHALLGYDGEWTDADKLGGNTDASANNGIDVWKEFLSLHSNIIIAAAGHIDVDPIKCKTEVGVNGNEVKTFLINPQTLDEANCYETGMIAMFYFSDDGSDVQVEYISAYKTLEAQASDPDAKDVLFGAENQFSFKTQKTLPLSSNTNYGYLDPDFSQGKTFALFSDNEVVSCYESFSDLCEYLNSRTNDNYQILLLQDYDNSVDGAEFPIGDVSITFDLGGHVFTVSDTLFDLSGESGNLEITVKNGIIAANNTVVGVAADSLGNAAVTFENVTVDFKDLVNSVTLFDIDDTNVSVIINVLGGNIVSDIAALSSVKFYEKDGNDTVIFGAYKNAYTKLITHTTAFDYDHYTGSFPTENGNRYFVEISDNGTESVYELRTLTVVGADVTATIDIATYGAKVLSAIDYPFVIADKSGSVVGIHDYIFNNNSDNTSAFGIAKYQINNGKVSDSIAYILMRTDYTLRKNISGANENYQSTYVKGTVVLDMCGHNIISPADRETWMFDITMRDASYTSTLIVKNGSLLSSGVKNSYFAYFKTNNSSSTATSFKKTFNLEFNGVTLGIVAGNSTVIERFFHTSKAGYATGSAPATLNFTLTDCTFDLRNQNQTNGKKLYVLGAYLGKSGSDNPVMNLNVAVNGGNIISNNVSNLGFVDASRNESEKLVFGDGSDGEYISLTLPKNVTAGSLFVDTVVKSESGKEIGLVLDTTDDKYIYKMYFATKCGNVSAKYSDANVYPFIVFGDDGTFIGAATSFNEKSSATSSISYAINYLKANTWNSSAETYGSNARSAIILMMRDYKTTDNEVPGNLYQLQGTLTIDLDNHTLTGANYKRMFQTDLLAWGSSGDESLFPTEIIVKDGTIKSYYVGVVFFNAKTSGKDFAYKFENVDFKFEQNTNNRNSSLIEYQANPVGIAYPTVEFNNCTYDLTHSAYKDGATLFGIGDDKTNVSVTVNGGSIIAGSKLFSISNATTGSGSLTFGKYDGKYITLVVSNISTAPTEKFNNGSLAFVKNGESEGETIYVLASVKIQNYIPKMSVTLDANLIVNVYIPVNGTQKFTFNGIEWSNLAELSDTVVNIDGENYYKVSASLDVSEAAKTLHLVTTVEYDGSTSTGSFTFSIIKYSERVIEGNNSTEKVLVSDILSYVRAAYDYFGINDADAIAKINELLGDEYDENSSPAFNGGSVAPSVGLSGATFILTSTPTIRFYLSDGANVEDYKFYIDGKLLSTESGSDDDGNYVDISVYAYLMGKTVTYSINGIESGSYHIRSYYEFAKTENDAKLVTLVERFAKYCESAEKYRNSVINNKEVNE